MGDSVLVDAQFGIAHILRPYTNFEDDYTGQIVLKPIMMTEGGLPLDPLAGQPGYSAKLVRGLSVPLGARICLWLPIIPSIITAGSGFASWNYKWAITWRLRNVHDFNVSRIPFHYPKQGAGVPDTTVPLAQQARVVIPAAVNPTEYAQPRPESLAGTNNFGPTAIIQADLAAVDATNTGALPLIPGGSNGYLEQGLTDPATTAQNQTYIIYEVEAEGDELLIGVTRDANSDFGVANSQPLWEFGVGQPDHQLSVFLGKGSGASFPDIGVYVMNGTSAP
jgi:hypothetical protein